MTTGFQRYSKGVKRCSKAALLLVVSAASGAAQPFDLEPLPTERPGYVLLENVGSGTVVTVDGRVVNADQRGDDQLIGPLPAGGASLAIWPDGVDVWKGREVRSRVAVRPADTVRVRPDLPSRVILTSVPYGAAVRLERDGQSEYLGVTPLTYDADSPQGTFVVEQEGFVAERIEFEDALTQHHAVLLQPTGQMAEGIASGVYTYGEARVPGRRWIDYAAAGLALAGAATAIYYKFEADALDDQYRDRADARYSDPALLNEAERLDTISLVGLGAMQVGVGVLAVRFVLR